MIKLIGNPLYICSVIIDGDTYYGVGIMDHQMETMRIQIPIEYVPIKIREGYINPAKPDELPRNMSELYIYVPLNGDDYDIIRRLSENELKNFTWLQSYYKSMPNFLGSTNAD
jgi:hypothetical protein